MNMTKPAARKLAERLIETLPFGMSGLFNPWRDSCPEDEPWNSPAAKMERLASHLDCQPRFILCGEAPGYQGCRHSGIAFTSEKLLMDGAIPRVAREDRRLTTKTTAYSEPSATIVWKTLYLTGIAEECVLWNSLQLHPHPVGQHQANRTPSPIEIDLGEPALRILLSAFPKAKLIAVGRKAEGLIQSMGIEPAGCVRHPARGGATEFSEGILGLVKGL